ncbi:MAG: Transporter [Verrucomicrobiales bacterium]|nr:Transporter [Verrucomicrobiales bacterium]
MLPTTPAARYALLSVAVALLTFALKLVAWHLTGSVTLLSDALESVANLAAALVAVASISIAARPADDEHAYGHSKVEYFAGGVEGALIILAAVGIGWTSVNRFFSPQELTGFVPGISVSVAASVLNLMMARVLFRAARNHHSIALEADAKHLMTDVWTSVAALLALVMIRLTGWLWLDPAIGLILTLHIVLTGVKLVHQSMLGLIDTSLPAAELELIRGILDRQAEQGVMWHALWTREAGTRRFMTVHVLVPGEWTVTRGHDLAEALEAELRTAVPRLHVLTHLEPIEDPISFRDETLDSPLPVISVEEKPSLSHSPSP